MPELYSNADALLITLKKSKIFSLTVPGKIQSYLACGKPILSMMDGEGSNIINESMAGFTAPAEEPNKLLDNILKMNAMIYGLKCEPYRMKYIPCYIIDIAIIVYVLCHFFLCSS